jgi:hypothetical protein
MLGRRQMTWARLDVLAVLVEPAGGHSVAQENGRSSRHNASQSGHRWVGRRWPCPSSRMGGTTYEVMVEAGLWRRTCDSSDQAVWHAR